MLPALPTFVCTCYGTTGTVDSAEPWDGWHLLEPSGGEDLIVCRWLIDLFEWLKVLLLCFNAGGGKVWRGFGPKSPLIILWVLGLPITIWSPLIYALLDLSIWGFTFFQWWCSYLCLFPMQNHLPDLAWVAGEQILSPGRTYTTPQAPWWYNPRFKLLCGHPDAAWWISKGSLYSLCILFVCQ